MGVNMNGFCIMDDEACREASRQEIIRRYYQALGKIVDDESARSEAYKIELIMKQAKITPNDRPVVPGCPFSGPRPLELQPRPWSCPMERSSLERPRSSSGLPLPFF